MKLSLIIGSVAIAALVGIGCQHGGDDDTNNPGIAPEASPSDSPVQGSSYVPHSPPLSQMEKDTMPPPDDDSAESHAEEGSAPAEVHSAPAEVAPHVAGGGDR